MKNKGKILGLDYGDKRIGIALSDENQQLSFGRECYTYKHISDFFEYIKEFVKEEKIFRIVIGLPLDEDGNETNQTKKVNEFGKKLKNLLNIDIKYQDEYLTSREGNIIISNLNIKDKRKLNYKEELNIIAAQKILEEYLNS